MQNDQKFIEEIDWIESEFMTIQEPNMQDRIIACVFATVALQECYGGEIEL